MSYDSLREAIVENIRPNGNQEITGQALQDALLGIIDEAEAADNLAAPKATTYTKTEVNNLVAEGLSPKADKATTYTKTEVGNLVAEAVAPKADKGGIYEQMTVGFAQDIVGDGSATEEEFSFRPTAGEDRNVANTTYYEGERNGVARIEKIKGNSVVWNQMFSNTLSPNNNGVGGWYNRQGANNITIEAGRVIITLATINNQMLSQRVNVKASHKYLVTINNIQYTYEPDSYNRVCQCGFSNSMNGSADNVTISGDTKSVQTIISTDIDYAYFTFFLRGVVSQDSLFGFDYPQLTDLTQMFGAGNEPTTVEEFYARIPKVADINAYNEGEIVDGNYGAIKTVGFNAFNGTYAKVCGGCPYYLGGNYTSLGFATEEGGTTEAITIPTSAESVGTTPSDRLYTPSQNGYIYAEGENININLSWDTEYGYLNGTYQPYKPFERDLSWVNEYFPATINGETKYGVRSAGSVRDEICFNSTTQKWEAVQNVGVRAYASGDESNSAVITDGTTTNYALTTPIVTEIEEKPSMDFDVSDYGTEELIVAEGVQSAALVADISYSPNALSTLKQVPDILKRLKALESALAEHTTNVEPSNIEE